MNATGLGIGMRTVFRSLAGFVCIATVLPVFRSRAWWIRGWDFPRAQVTVLGGAALGLACRAHLQGPDRWLFGLTSAAVAAQLAQMAKYTPLVPKQVVARPRDPDRTLTILTANVRMRNRSAERLVQVVRSRDPDLVLLLETDSWWAAQMESLHARYPYRVLQLQDNTYGLVLFSKLPLVDPEVRFLVQKDVPSVRAKLRLRDQREVWFYGLHPRPPMRASADGEVELPGSAARDAELVVAGLEIKDLREPVIVAGDFNDVAWSHTTRRFQRLSRTLDPRVGRGLYSTFHARNSLLRFPLDHLFISEHFALAEFQRERDIGSDHFPLYAGLVLHPTAPADQEPPRPDVTDFQEAKEDLSAAAEQS